MLKKIQDDLNSHKKIVEDCFSNLQNYVYTAFIIINETLNNGNKIYIFGNGINAIVAQYITFQINQKFPNFVAKILSDKISISSSKIHDEDKVFEKQIANIVNSGDLLIGISTSGNSKNVLRGLSLGKNLGCKTIGLSGYDGGAMNEFCDINLVVPSDNTSRVQEMYIMIAELICQNIGDS